MGLPSGGAHTRGPPTPGQAMFPGHSVRSRRSFVDTHAHVHVTGLASPSFRTAILYCCFNRERERETERQRFSVGPVRGFCGAFRTKSFCHTFLSTCGASLGVLSGRGRRATLPNFMQLRRRCTIGPACGPGAPPRGGQGRLGGARARRPWELLAWPWPRGCPTRPTGAVCPPQGQDLRLTNAARRRSGHG